MAGLRIVYCLTRDRELASALDSKLPNAIAFFYNDAARLNQAVALREPDIVVIDTGAVRPEYGDAGLGPVFDFLRHRTPRTQLCVRPATGAAVLVAAEAGAGVALLPADRSACVGAVLAMLGA